MTQPLRVLVLGASGQVGHALTALDGQWLRPAKRGERREARESQRVALTPGSTAGPRTLKVVGLTRHEADLASPLFAQQLRAALATHNPTHVINAAAYTSVDRAEVEPGLAQAINATAVETLGQVCKAAGVPVIHLSTDYVFDGRKPVGQAYTPDDAVSPQCVYGRTKAEGEARLMAATQGHPALVFRTSWVFSAHGSNFVKTMLTLAEQRDELRVVNDQHGAPTSAEWIAQSLLKVCAQWPAARNEGPALTGPALRGIFHLTAGGETTWHAFAQHLLAEARAIAPSRPWRIQSNDQVLAVSTAAYEQGMRASGRNAPMAPRPVNSVLDNSSTMATFQLGGPLEPSSGVATRAGEQRLPGGDSPVMPVAVKDRPGWPSQLRPVLQALLTPGS
ncbi:RfbD dTDP-4-dehydrorhamnose reductase [Burkholderiales bacterium]